MLLCQSGEVGEDHAVESAGECSFEAADDLAVGQALGGAASGVVAGLGVVVCESDHDDGPECVVGLAVAAAVSRCRLVLPDEAGMGLAPQRAANEASVRQRSGLSPAATMSLAATSGPTPNSLSSVWSGDLDEFVQFGVEALDLRVEFEPSLGEGPDRASCCRVGIGAGRGSPTSGTLDALASFEAAEVVTDMIWCSEDQVADL